MTAAWDVKKSAVDTAFNCGRYTVNDLEVLSTKDGVTLSMDIPGTPCDSLSVCLKGGKLTLSGRIDFGEAAEPRFRECRFGDFFRHFSLNRKTDFNRISVLLKDGVLTLTIPCGNGLSPESARPGVESNTGEKKMTGEKRDRGAVQVPCTPIRPHKNCMQVP